MPGKLIIFSAPSGAGKTTIVQAMLERVPQLEFSISACSRPKRKNETGGRDYYFLGIEGFRRKISEGAFLEWEEVYPEHYYGTLLSEVYRIWDAGRHVIFDVDVFGGLNIKSKFPEQALAIFVMPPSLEELEKRLRDRSTEDEDSLRKRLEKARYEISKAGEFDKVIVNDELDKAIEEAFNTVKAFVEENEKGS